MFRGPESGTKTTLSILACVKYLERFPTMNAIYLDVEDKFDPSLIKRFGIDVKRFIIPIIENAEKTIDYIDKILRKPRTGILVVDSLAALCPQIEIDASAEDQQQGVAARELNKLMRKTISAMKAGYIHRGWSPTVIFINQERYKIGSWGNPITIPGGEGQKYLVSLILRLRTLKPGKEDHIPEDAPLAKVAASVVKHNFGKVMIMGVEYFFAMKDYKNLKAGEAMDTEFLWRMAQKMNLVDEVGSQGELERRGEFYHQLKKVFCETLEREE